jgi:hypothetical protein
MHTSIKLDSPIELINITPLNPLISKCQIKVCYVGDKPNRNRSIITKEVAKQMANSLPGCPIVGFYNEEKQDFEEHNRVIDISNGKFEIKDTTRPYGFVDLNAKVWFQKYLDDGMNEHEYMMTEGWLWTGQYPECRRILSHGNNQSMELDEETIDAHWSKDGNGNPKFFIINEAIISKLCTLGVENEPCFEGSNITAPTIQFAFEDGFKEQLFSMMNELKEYLNKGGEKVFTRCEVEIGDALWTALYNHVKDAYTIESVCEDGEQKFAVLTADDKYYRLDFSTAEEGFEFAAEATLLEEYTPAEEPQFDAAAVTAYVNSLETVVEETAVEEVVVEEVVAEESVEEVVAEEAESVVQEEVVEEESIIEEEDKKEKYNLDEIQEYVELSEKYSNLETEYAAAQTTIEELQGKISELTSFKNQIERKEKENMIKSFYMLSDEEKKDVVENIDAYSLEDIEAKLSVICVRNKVSFNLDEDKDDKIENPTTYNLDGGLNGDEAVPAWIKVLRSVASEM